MTLFSILALLLSSPPSFGADKWKDLHFAADCRIFDAKGSVILDFPGRDCFYMDDGRLVSSSGSELALFDSNRKKLWSIQRHFHHQLNMTDDQKAILAISSSFVKRGKKTIRYDAFLKIGLDGKIISEQSAEALLQDPKFIADGTKVFEKSFGWDSSVVHADFEIGHFNSIYEVPEQADPKKSLPFEKGQIVVNSVIAGVFVLSPDLKTLVYHNVFDNAWYHSVHDAQLLTDGTFLYLTNRNTDFHDGPYSSIDIFDPKENKSVYHFTSEPKQFFYSHCCGSVQLIDPSTLLVSDVLKGVFILDKKSKTLVHSFPKFAFRPAQDGRDTAPAFLGRVKAKDLTSFLSHWK